MYMYVCACVCVHMCECMLPHIQVAFAEVASINQYTDIIGKDFTFVRNGKFSTADVHVGNTVCTIDIRTLLVNTELCGSVCWRFVYAFVKLAYLPHTRSHTRTHSLHTLCASCSYGDAPISFTDKEDVLLLTDSHDTIRTACVQPWPL